MKTLLLLMLLTFINIKTYCKGDGITDDAIQLAKVINLCDSSGMKIVIPANFKIAISSLDIRDKNYVHFESHGGEFVSLGTTQGDIGFMNFTNIKNLIFEGEFVLNGNYPKGNTDWAMNIVAPIVQEGTFLSVGTFGFKGLPFKGLRIMTKDFIYTGYETVRINQLTCVNAINKRKKPDEDFNYLYLRGAHKNVTVDKLYLKQDNETWSDNPESPNCKMFNFSSESESFNPHMGSLRINDLYSDYACSVVLFLQGIDNVNIERIALYNTCKKPSVSDKDAYSNIQNKSWSFVKLDYASPNRTKNRVRIGSFIMANTSSALSVAGNFAVGLWVDEGLEDAYIDQIDTDLRCNFEGNGSTTPYSGKTIINQLTLRLQGKPNTSMKLVSGKGIVGTVKLIDSNATYGLGTGTIKNIIEEGNASPTIQVDINSDGNAGTEILSGNLTSATLLFVFHEGASLSKYSFNNINGTPILRMLLEKNGLNVTGANYDGDYENQIRDNVQINIENSKFKVDMNPLGILSRLLPSLKKYNSFTNTNFTEIS